MVVFHLLHFSAHFHSFYILPGEGVPPSNRRGACEPVRFLSFYGAPLFGLLRGILVHSAPQVRAGPCMDYVTNCCCRFPENYCHYCGRARYTACTTRATLPNSLAKRELCSHLPYHTIWTRCTVRSLSLPSLTSKRGPCLSPCSFCFPGLHDCKLRSPCPMALIQTPLLLRCRRHSGSFEPGPRPSEWQRWCTRPVSPVAEAATFQPSKSVLLLQLDLRHLSVRADASTRRLHTCRPTTTVCPRSSGVRHKLLPSSTAWHVPSCIVRACQLRGMQNVWPLDRGRHKRGR